jgi:hypothetical protein
MREATYTTGFTRDKLVNRNPPGSCVAAATEREFFVVDSFVANNNGFNSAAANAAEDEHASQHNYVDANMSFHPTLDVKESLEWLLGAEEESLLPNDERVIRRERRVDLLVWLLNLNLEPRLGPYGAEPA